MFEFFPGNYRWSYNSLLAFAGGAELGDVALIIPRLQESGGDDETWHREWTWLGSVLERRAAESQTAQTASENLFLASLYHTIGEHFVPPADPRRLVAYRHVLAVFEQARSLSSLRLERVLVPFEETTLPAYFMPASGGNGPYPTVILICGLDTTKELWFLRARQAFAERGLNSLFIDTPGIGEAVRLQKLYTRHDYEQPVSAAVDYLANRPEVDNSRIGMVGSSLGGYYVARAAAYESRITATVAWGAIYDYHAVWVRRLTTGGTVAAPSFQLMFITGADTTEEAVRRVENFKVAPFAKKIRCPFLIVHGAEDLQVPVADAQAMFEAIGALDKELKVFSGEDGGAAHTQFDNHLPAMHYVADWLALKLNAAGIRPTPKGWCR